MKDNNVIENSTGSELPSTGGIGTTIFYVVGGLLMAAAVVLLVTKKKVASGKFPSVHTLPHERGTGLPACPAARSGYAALNRAIGPAQEGIPALRRFRRGVPIE